MDAMAINQIRSFNRTVAEGIGALDTRFLGRARPMAEARVLWEIGTAGADLHGLRTRLGLDPTGLARRSGYVEVEAFNSEPYAHHWFEKIIA